MHNNSLGNTVTLQHTQPIFGSGTVGLGLGHALAPSRLAANLNTSNIITTNTNTTNSTNNNTTNNTTTSTVTSSVTNSGLSTSDTTSDLATFREALIMHSKSILFMFFFNLNIRITSV